MLARNFAIVCILMFVFALLFSKLVVDARLGARSPSTVTLQLGR